MTFRRRARQHVDRTLARNALRFSVRLMEELEARMSDRSHYIDLFNSGLWLDLTTVERRAVTALRQALEKGLKQYPDSTRKRPPRTPRA